jgi:hypothetical protein
MQSNTTTYSPKIIQTVKNISIFLIEKKSKNCKAKPKQYGKRNYKIFVIVAMAVVHILF